MIEKLVYNSFQVNMYIIAASSGNCILIDPSNSNKAENFELHNYLESKQLKPKIVVLTHGHFDHCVGLKFIIEKYNPSVYLHSGDLFLIEQAKELADMFGFEFHKWVGTPTSLDDMNKIILEDIELSILHTPGHSPGGIALYNKKSSYIITGDTLFLNSIGRYDLPGGNFNQIIESIKTTLFTLPSDTAIYPGHGAPSTIQNEMINNPYTS